MYSQQQYERASRWVRRKANKSQYLIENPHILAKIKNAYKLFVGISPHQSHSTSFIWRRSTDNLLMKHLKILVTSFEKYFFLYISLRFYSANTHQQPKSGRCFRRIMIRLFVRFLNFFKLIFMWLLAIFLPFESNDSISKSLLIEESKKKLQSNIGNLNFYWGWRSVKDDI